MSDVEHVESSEIEIGTGVRRTQTKTLRCANVTLRLIFSTPGLVILVVIYSIMGALIFPLLEAPTEIQNAVSISKSREDCLKELWTITERLNVLYERNWTLLVHEQLRRFEGSIVAATKGGFMETMGDRFPRWSFSEALLYSVTVITTIGHGNLTPRTSEGKIVTMLYALVGVPLMLMCLSSLGGLLADALQCTYGKLCGLRKGKNQDNVHEGCQQFEEVDCNVCKYDSVTKDIKQNTYDKYTAVCDREDSCHLIRNSPSKSISSSPQHNLQPTIQIKNQNDKQILMGQTLIGKQTLQKHQLLHHNIGSNITTGNTYFPQTSLQQCHQNQNSKYHGMQLQSNITNNERNNHLVVYHTATVHGIGRSKFIPKPMPQEINMLLAECDLNCQQDSSSSSASTNNTNKCAKNDCVDDDDDEDNRIGCPHDTPSRIPLITSKHQNQLLSDDNDDDEHDDSITSYSPQVPITIILIILTSYICLGTIIFSIWENWSIIEAAYFCFVTLSTIGFADLVPKKTFRGPDLQLFACCAYLMLGLVLVAMSFSLLETQLLWKCRRMAVRLKLAKD